MQVILYARVSSDDETTKSISIAGQLRLMREFAALQDWQVREEFSDCGISGRNDRRPGFQEMLKFAQQAPEIVAVLVWSYSRFSRNYETSRLYRAALRRYDVDIISVTEPFEEPVVRLLDAIAEYYCSMISKYTKMAMRERVLQGYCCGGVAPFGYRRVTKQGKTQLEPDPKSAPIVQRIYDMYLEGYKIKEIATSFNDEKIRHRHSGVWDYQRLYRILKNEVYTGLLQWGKNGEEQICIPQAHPAVISAETFQQVQETMRR